MQYHRNPTPRETHEILKRPKTDAGGGANRHGDIFIAENGHLTQGFDSAIYNSAKVQRPCGFLTLYRAEDTGNLDRYAGLGNIFDTVSKDTEDTAHSCILFVPI